MAPNALTKKRLHAFITVFITLLLSLVLALIDHKISRHPSLVLFYLAPIFISTWLVGPVFGAFIALVSAGTWFVHDINAMRGLYYEPVFFYGNMVTRIGFLLVVVYVLSKLKTTLTRERILTEKLREQNEKLADFDRRKSAFVSNVSHELQTPLVIATEYIDLMLAGTGGNLSAKQEEILQTVKRRVGRLMRLVQDILDLSRIEAGKLELRREEIDIAGLLRDEADAFKLEISRKEIVFKLSIQQDAGMMWGDKDKLIEVVTNLLNNAVKYTPAGGMITLGLTANEKEVRCELFNTGPGISPEDKERIFDKFERIKTEKMEGTGLGLPITKDIVRLHNGKIWVESELGKGSKFIVVLPRSGLRR